MASTPAAQAMAADFRSMPMSNDVKVSTLHDMASELPDDEKKRLAHGLLFETKPDQKTANTLYLIIIGALIVILLVAAAILFKIVDTGAEIDKVLGIFTTVLTFILGLFAPSPVAKS